MLLSGGLVVVFGSRLASFGGAGALGCLVLSFVAAYGWRRQGWNEDNVSLPSSSITYLLIVELYSFAFLEPCGRYVCELMDDFPANPVRVDWC